MLSLAADLVLLDTPPEHAVLAVVGLPVAPVERQDSTDATSRVPCQFCGEQKSPAAVRLSLIAGQDT